MAPGPGEMGLSRPPAAGVPVLPPPKCRDVWTRLLLAGEVGEGQRDTVSTGRVTAGALRCYLLLHSPLGTAITGRGQPAHEQRAHSGCSGQWGWNGRWPCGVIGAHAVSHAVTHFLQPRKSLPESCQVRWGQLQSSLKGPPSPEGAERAHGTSEVTCRPGLQAGSGGRSEPTMRSAVPQHSRHLCFSAGQEVTVRTSQRARVA